MKVVLSGAGRVIAALCVLSLIALGSPAAASADRCQPEELLGAGWQIMPESDSAACVLMIDVVYPALACDATTLARCLQTFDPVATANNLPDTVSQTPSRVLGTPDKIQTGLQNQVRGNCVYEAFRPFSSVESYVSCRIVEAQGKLPPP